MLALYPRLDGQHASYIATQLRLWMSGVRGGRQENLLALVMALGVGVDPARTPAQPTLRPQEIEAVAAWYAAQSPAQPGAVAAER